MESTPTAAAIAEQHNQPTAQLQTAEGHRSRPDIVGSDYPDPPFPVFLAGPVQKGFGRGGKDLGCPTANLPDDSIGHFSAVAKPGIYYGYAQVRAPKEGQTKLESNDFQVFPMVMSLGWNPFYKNERLTAEIHIMHSFNTDFYGDDLRAVVLGYIRPEYDFISREALIQDIETDKKVALKSLDRPRYREYTGDAHFSVERSNL